MRTVADHVVSLDDAERLVRAAQERGETIVLCHGCFDIVHPGHVRHLRQAAALGQRLIVTVTGDGVVAKGTGRPLIPQELRAENLASLDCVSWVAISPESTALGVLDRLRPDVYVKGREYEFNHDPRFLEERRLVESYGGRIVFTSGDVVFSSTALIRAFDGALDPAHTALAALVERHAAGFADAERLVASFRGRRVLVTGETVVDTYVMCDRPEVAGEAPVMTLRPIEYRSYDGGAAIVARHLAALGARPVLVTALPEGPAGEPLRVRLEVEGVEVHAIRLGDRVAEKQRFLVGAGKVMKLDLTPPLLLDGDLHRTWLGMLAAAADGADAAIICDFGLGLWTASRLEEACRGLRDVVPLLVGDVSGRRANLRAMHDVDLLAPSELEIRAAMHDYEQGLTAVVWNLLERTGARAAIVKMGEEGLTAFRRRGEVARGGEWNWPSRLAAEHVPALTRLPLDPLGCGDALLASATLALVAGASLEFAAIVGAAAAAIEAQRLGNVVVGAADLRASLALLAETRPVFDLHHADGPAARRRG